MPELERVDLHLADAAERMCVWETEHLQIMRMRLGVGESLPPHNANSDVLLLPLEGTITFAGEGRTETFGVGEALSVPYDTPMKVSNGGGPPALLLVLKAPHPKQYPPA